jgi:hypothetical protein
MIRVYVHLLCCVVCVAVPALTNARQPKFAMHYDTSGISGPNRSTKARPTLTYQPLGARVIKDDCRAVAKLLSSQFVVALVCLKSLVLTMLD